MKTALIIYITLSVVLFASSLSALLKATQNKCKSYRELPVAALMFFVLMLIPCYRWSLFATVKKECRKHI